MGRGAEREAATARMRRTKGSGECGGMAPTRPRILRKRCWRAGSRPGSCCSAISQRISKMKAPCSSALASSAPGGGTAVVGKAYRGDSASPSSITHSGSLRRSRLRGDFRDDESFLLDSLLDDLRGEDDDDESSPD